MRFYLSIILMVTAIDNVSAVPDSVKYYYITKTDTVLCKTLKYGTTAQGWLSWINGTDLNGKEIYIRGRKKVPYVSTFCINGTFYDRVPLKANKPKKYIRYDKRRVDGKLKVYLGKQGTMNTTTMNLNTGQTKSSSVASGSYRFFIKMPNGKYYKINKAKNMNKVIKPYLLQCEEFKNQYKGDFSKEEAPFMEMIRLYNSLCK